MFGFCLYLLNFIRFWLFGFIWFFHVPHHNDAYTSMLSGDWFLGRYAHNCFARNLLPRLPQHANIITGCIDDASTVCLACWHFRRTVFTEDEQHIVHSCPEYARARAELYHAIGEPISNTNDALDLLCTSQEHHLRAIARFLAQARQIRRRNKCTLESLSHQVGTINFAAKRAAWRFKGKWACRHGVLFSRAPPGGCRCMAISTEPSEWQLARFMPQLDHRLKCLVATPFDLPTFVRLATLQARSRQLNW